MSEQITASIYGLHDPLNPSVIMVVGKTNLPLDARVYHYIWHAKRRLLKGRSLSPSYRWIIQLLRRGVQPKIRLLESCALANWKSRERRMISIWRNRNPKLLNVLDGGNGTESKTPKLICECGTRRRVRKFNGSRICPKCKARYDKKYRREHRAYFKRYSRRPERRAYDKAYNNTPERREYMRLYMRGQKRRAWLRRPEVRARIKRNRLRRLRVKQAAQGKPMINPKFLYICPKDIFQAHGCKHFISAHAIDLPDGNLLISGEFADEQRKEGFEKHVTVEPVAHDGDTVCDAHAQILSHLGVKTGHTAKQVRTLAKKIHGLM